MDEQKKHIRRKHATLLITDLEVLENSKLLVASMLFKNV